MYVDNQLAGFSLKKIGRSIKKTIRAPSRLITKNPMMQLATGTKDPKKIKQRLTAAAVVGAGVLAAPTIGTWGAKVGAKVIPKAGGFIKALGAKFLPGAQPQAAPEEVAPPDAMPAPATAAPSWTDYATQAAQFYQQQQAQKLTAQQQADAGYMPPAPADYAEQGAPMPGAPGMPGAPSSAGEMLKKALPWIATGAAIISAMKAGG